ncbi:hypothetical protein U9M48_020093 [Paspalum notatum var. saurae]|uniref:Secreted protein n=1 Tax=Paspalum notatum var. saurae TaxID=547442 RepID=A0AAQ3WRM8_PASNO
MVGLGVVLLESIWEGARGSAERGCSCDRTASTVRWIRRRLVVLARENPWCFVGADLWRKRGVVRSGLDAAAAAAEEG